MQKNGILSRTKSFPEVDRRILWRFTCCEILLARGLRLAMSGVCFGAIVSTLERLARDLSAEFAHEVIDRDLIVAMAFVAYDRVGSEVAA